MSSYLGQQIALLKQHFCQYRSFRDKRSTTYDDTSNLVVLIREELMEFEKQSSSLMNQNTSLRNQIKLEKKKLDCIKQVRQVFKLQVERLKEANSQKEGELRKTIKNKHKVNDHISYLRRKIEREELQKESKRRE